MVMVRLSLAVCSNTSSPGLTFSDGGSRFSSFLHAPADRRHAIISTVHVRKNDSLRLINDVSMMFFVILVLVDAYRIASAYVAARCPAATWTFSETFWHWGFLAAEASAVEFRIHALQRCRGYC